MITCCLYYSTRLFKQVALPGSVGFSIVTVLFPSSFLILMKPFVFLFEF